MKQKRNEDDETYVEPDIALYAAKVRSQRAPAIVPFEQAVAVDIYGGLTITISELIK